MRAIILRSSCAALLAVLAVADCEAQVPIGLGIRMGVTRQGNWSNSGSFDLAAMFRLNRVVAITALFGGTELGTSETDPSIDLVITGLSLGVDVTPGASAGRRITPWIHAALGMYVIDAYGGGIFSNYAEDSPSKVGVDLGAGVSIALTRRLQLTPALRFVGVSPNWTYPGFGGPGGSVESVRYGIFDVGLTWHFGTKATAPPG